MPSPASAFLTVTPCNGSATLNTVSPRLNTWVLWAIVSELTISSVLARGTTWNSGTNRPSTLRIRCGGEVSGSGRGGARPDPCRYTTRGLAPTTGTLRLRSANPPSASLGDVGSRFDSTTTASATTPRASIVTATRWARDGVNPLLVRAIAADSAGSAPASRSRRCSSRRYRSLSTIDFARNHGGRILYPPIRGGRTSWNGLRRRSDARTGWRRDGGGYRFFRRPVLRQDEIIGGEHGTYARRGVDEMIRQHAAARCTRVTPAGTTC